jgi:hypothetical protein
MWSPVSKREQRERVIRWSRSCLIDAARPGREEVLADLDRIRAMTPEVPQTDAAELMREDRDLGWR